MAKERTSASYRKIEHAAVVVIDSVVVIARIQSSLSVREREKKKIWQAMSLEHWDIPHCSLAKSLPLPLSGPPRWI